jgi:hypothetical protein
MALNKDLFGKIPVTSKVSKDFIPQSVLRQRMQKPSVDFRKNTEGTEVYHATRWETRDEFMKAPVIHVGSADQAALRINPFWEDKIDEFGEPLYDGRPENVPNVHRLAISPHAKIHPITVPDDIANEAHAHFLQEKGHHVPESINMSRSFHGVEHPLVKSALNALRQNRIVPYQNEWEAPKLDYEMMDNASVRYHTTSYLVPSPSLNMAQFGESQKLTQPTLPLDYTGVLPESDTTKLYRSEGVSVIK